MTFIVLIPEFILLLNLLIYGFMLSSSNLKLIKNKFINSYIFIVSIISILLWLVFLLFIPDQIILSYNIYSNKLFTIFKFYIIFSVLIFYFINIQTFNIFRFFTLSAITLASFIIISFNSDLTYFIGFILLTVSLIAFLITYNIKKDIIFNLAPLAFLFAFFMSYSKNNLFLLFVLFSVTLLSYFAKNIKIHYLLNSIVIPTLFFYLIKISFVLDALFYKNLLLFGIILLILSTALTFSKNFKNNSFYYLVLNYLAHIYILIGLKSHQATVLALFLLLIIPLILKNDFISNLSTSMTALSPLFIVKLIFLILVFNYSISIFFIIIFIYPFIIINSVKNLNTLKLNLTNKLLFLYIFVLFFFVSVFFTNLVNIVKKVTY